MATLVGSGDGLASERHYTTRVLPRGLVGRLAGVVRPNVGMRHRVDLAAQATMLTGGLLVTTVGYVRGRLAGVAIPDRSTPLHLHLVDNDPQTPDAIAGGVK